MGRLTGKVAIITGGASGIGAATVQLFANEGAKVAICDISDAAGIALATAIGPDVAFHHLDVSLETEWASVVTKVEESFGRIDILVNDAGYFVPGTIQASLVTDFDKQVDVNQKGVMLGMREVVGAMKRAGGGAIVNVASTGGLRGGPDMFIYRATKWAVRGMTRSAAHDLAEFNIRVNTVLPGPIETPMMKGNPPEKIDAMRDRTLMKRLGKPAELGAAIVFLASDEASFITGIDLPVDGGTMA